MKAQNWKKGQAWAAVLILAGAGGLSSACSEEDYDGAFVSKGRGELVFTANGEEFARQGFTSMDGWEISFDHVYINLSNIVAYQVAEASAGLTSASLAGDGMIVSAHAGHPHSGGGETATAGAEAPLPGVFLVDLAAGDGPTELGKVLRVVEGNYNRLRFAVSPLEEGVSEPVAPVAAGVAATYSGFTLVLIGQATNGGDVVDFTLTLDEALSYSACGPNGLAGVVRHQGTGTAEMTFHLDHVFGDFETLGEPGSVNETAVGFQPFADLIGGSGALDLDQDQLAAAMSGADFLTFIDALRTIGHSGEGHCDLNFAP